MPVNQLNIKQQLQALESLQPIKQRLGWDKAVFADIEQQAALSKKFGHPAAFDINKVLVKAAIIDTSMFSLEQKAYIKRWLWANLYLFNQDEQDFQQELIRLCTIYLAAKENDIAQFQQGLNLSDNISLAEFKGEQQAYISTFEGQYRAAMIADISYEDLVLAYAIYAMNLAKAKESPTNFKTQLALKVNRELSQAGYKQIQAAKAKVLVDFQVALALILGAASAAALITLLLIFAGVPTATSALTCFVICGLTGAAAGLLGYNVKDYFKDYSQPAWKARRHLDNLVEDQLGQNAALQHITRYQNNQPNAAGANYNNASVISDQYQFGLFNNQPGSQGAPTPYSSQTPVNSEVLSGYPYSVQQGMPAPVQRYYYQDYSPYPWGG